MLRLFVLCLTALFVAGCGKDTGSDVPAACRDATAAQVRSALESAPGRVRLAGVPLSDCFNRNAGQGDVEALGAVFIDVAENLAGEARRGRDGEAATRLGYLLGAADRGAGRTQGIHTELIRRLRTTSAGLEDDAGFRRGQSAGRANG